jgi:hypothetical protein
LPRENGETSSDSGSVTALRFVVFNDADDDHSLAIEWQQIMRQLYPLHEERLRQSAAALGHRLQTFSLEQHINEALDSAALHPPTPGQIQNYKVRIVIAPKQHRDSDLLHDITCQRQYMANIPDDLEIEIEFQYIGNLPIEDESLTYLVANFTINPFNTTPTTTFTPATVRISKTSTEPSMYTRNKTTVRTPYDTVRIVAKSWKLPAALSSSTGTGVGSRPVRGAVV